MKKLQFLVLFFAVLVTASACSHVAEDSALPTVSKKQNGAVTTSPSVTPSVTATPATTPTKPLVLSSVPVKSSTLPDTEKVSAPAIPEFTILPPGGWAKKSLGIDGEQVAFQAPDELNENMKDDPTQAYFLFPHVFV